MKSLSVSVRLHAEEDTVKDVRGQEQRRQHIRARDNVCVCVRKKTDVRAGCGATSFHSTYEHVWVRSRVMKSARSPSTGVRVWRRYRAQMNQKLW